jgi:CheY-like chemotaxis protein
MSVNLSARELLNLDIADSVRSALDASGLDPRHLCLEITESVILGDAEASARALSELKSLGVRLAIDDFGTGYSALTYLKQFPVDTLKIDQSFVVGLDGDVDRRGDRAIVAGLIDLAHAFGLTTVAEGVETPEQLAQLHSLGCELAQGFWLGRPMPADEATRWMQTERRRAGAEAGRPAHVGHTDFKRVLVVEDDQGLRRMVRLLLEDHFDVVGEAPGGREAVALARHHQPDIVLLDLAMPGVGGLEALPLIRAVAPDAKVVVLSGLDPGDIADEAVVCGAAGYVQKGNPEHLVEEVNRILAVAAV